MSRFLGLGLKYVAAIHHILHRVLMWSFIEGFMDLKSLENDLPACLNKMANTLNSRHASIVILIIVALFAFIISTYLLKH